jgi:hypothetical protein
MIDAPRRLKGELMIWHIEYKTRDDATGSGITVLQNADQRWIWMAWDANDDFVDGSSSVTADGYATDREAREAADLWFRTVYLPASRPHTYR